jgi:hypothetical protein
MNESTPTSAAHDSKNSNESQIEEETAIFASTSLSLLNYSATMPLIALPIIPSLSSTPRLYNPRTFPSRPTQSANRSSSHAYINEPYRQPQRDTRTPYPCHWVNCYIVCTTELEIHDHLLNTHFERHEPRSKSRSQCMWRPGPGPMSSFCGYVYKTNTSFRGMLCRIFIIRSHHITLFQ